jgi:hypothetical protein
LKGLRFAVKGLALNRQLVRGCVLASALALPAGASAGPTRPAAGIAAVVQARGSTSGTVALVNGSSFTIQTPGRPAGVVNALSGGAENVTKHDYPYVYGGGHGQAGVASIGIKGTGYNGHRLGYDCSGSVAAVLVGAGLWPAGAGVPNDAGIITQLRSAGLIAAGVGVGPTEVTLYDHPGVHIFMNIDGRFFGTSDGGGGGNPRGGAGWLYDGAPDASSRQYKRYHFLPSVLKQSTNAGHSVTFEIGGDGGGSNPQGGGAAIGGLLVGEKVQVSYEELGTGTIVATGISYPGAVSTGGTVNSIAADGSSFTIQAAGGSSLTFSTDPSLIDAIAIGDTVQVAYSSVGSMLIVHAVSVTAVAAPVGQPIRPRGT